jgi:predicted RecA/RadA family phage recombinase
VFPAAPEVVAVGDVVVVGDVVAVVAGTVVVDVADGAVVEDDAEDDGAPLLPQAARTGIRRRSGAISGRRTTVENRTTPGVHGHRGPGTDG